MISSHVLLLCLGPPRQLYLSHLSTWSFIQAFQYKMPFCWWLVGTVAHSHTTRCSTEPGRSGFPLPSVGPVFRTFQCVSAGRHPLMPEWSQQATMCLHGDGTQSVGAHKANIVLLSPPPSFIHPYKLNLVFLGSANAGAGLRSRVGNCFCCISELSQEWPDVVSL